MAKSLEIGGNAKEGQASGTEGRDWAECECQGAAPRRTWCPERGPCLHV